MQGVGVVAQLLELSIGTEPGAVVGEARIGLYQRVAAVGLHAEQAGAGQLRVRHTHHDAVRRAAGGVDCHAALAVDAIDGVLRDARLRDTIGCHRVRAVQRTGTATADGRLITLHIQVRQHRRILHVGRSRALVDVAQITYVDLQRATTGDRAADIADRRDDRWVTPRFVIFTARTIGGVFSIVVAVQRLRQVSHAGRAGDAVDAQVAAGGDACVGVVQVIGDEVHRAAGVDHRIWARTRLQHILLRDVLDSDVWLRTIIGALVW